MSMNSQYNYVEPKTLKDALKIFGYEEKDLPRLNEDEIKRVYRAKSREYHPDRNPGDEEKKLKFAALSIAYSIIKNHINNRQKQTYRTQENQNSLNLHEYISHKIKELNKKLDEQGIELNDEDYEDYEEIYKKISNIIFDLETDILFFASKETFDRSYQKTQLEISKALENFKKTFYQKYSIDESEVKITINYDEPVISFFVQLVDIKNKYSKKVKVNKQLDEELEQYKGYAGYEHLKILIGACKHNAIYYIKKNNFQNIEEEINKMHKTIQQEVFEAYYALKKKISDLESIVNNVTDESIKKEYLDICNHFERGASFYDTEQEIKKIEQRISEYQKIQLEKQKQREIEEKINKIYQSLIARYSEVLKQYNIVKEFKEIKKLNEFIKEILQVFSKGCEEFKDLDFFKTFDNITFTDETIDNEVIQNILKGLNRNKSKVYVKRKDKLRLFDQTSFFYLDTDKMEIYRISVNTVFDKKNITQKELDENYINLDELLSISEYVGKYMVGINNFDEKYIYYKTDGYIIFQEPNNEKIRILINPDKHLSGDDRHHNLFDDKMKDKKIMQCIIEEQVREQVEEYKKQQAQKTGSYTQNPNIYGEPVFNTDDSYYNNGTSQQRRR